MKAAATDYEQTTFHSMCARCVLYAMCSMLFFFIYFICIGESEHCVQNAHTTHDILWKSFTSFSIGSIWRDWF